MLFRNRNLTVSKESAMPEEKKKHRCRTRRETACNTALRVRANSQFVYPKEKTNVKWPNPIAYSSLYEGDNSNYNARIIKK